MDNYADEPNQKPILRSGQWRKFLVGAEVSEQQIFSVDKLILAKASPIFARMFYGSSADNSDVILVPDITPLAFSAMLDYIYTETLRVGSFQHACELYVAATKYVLPQAIFDCSCYLLQSVNPQNICIAYEFSKLHNEPLIKNKCTEMFPNAIREIITQPNFMKIKLSTLREILCMDDLMISETELFIAFKNYVYENNYILELNENSKSNNQLQNIQKQEIYKPDDDDEASRNKRNIEDLKYSIRKIRFLTFSAQQFAQIAAKSGILTDSEALAILINIVSPGTKVCSMPEGFSVSRSRRYNYTLPYVDSDYVPSFIRTLFN